MSCRNRWWYGSMFIPVIIFSTILTCSSKHKPFILPNSLSLLWVWRACVQCATFKDNSKSFYWKNPVADMFFFYQLRGLWSAAESCLGLAVFPGGHSWVQSSSTYASVTWMKGQSPNRFADAAKLGRVADPCQGHAAIEEDLDRLDHGQRGISWNSANAGSWTWGRMTPGTGWEMTW